MFARILSIGFVLWSLGACTYNVYPGEQMPPGLAQDCPPQEFNPQRPRQARYDAQDAGPAMGMQGQPEGPVDINSLPVLNGSPEAQAYVRSIPPGMYKPMWNQMRIGEDVQHTRLANVVVDVNNQGRFLDCDAPCPRDNLPWKRVKVAVYAKNSDHTVRLDARGQKIEVLAPLWVAEVQM